MLAFWIDSRDRQTLRDIRCSYSDDGGRHWSPSQKINDDKEHVWQGKRVWRRGNQIYVAFEDFREPGEGGDYDWNIYFTKSEDNGNTWSKNIRLNDIQEGEDSGPFLTIDEHGDLYCVWRSSRRRIFGDIYVAHSTDSGHSWSGAIRINKVSKWFSRACFAFAFVSGELCHWLEQHSRDRRVQISPGWNRFLRAPAEASGARDAKY